MIDWPRELAIAIRAAVVFAAVLAVAFAVIGFGTAAVWIGEWIR